MKVRLQEGVTAARSQLTVWIPAELHAWLRLRRYTHGRLTLQGIVVAALEQYREREEAGKAGKRGKKRSK